MTQRLYKAISRPETREYAPYTVAYVDLVPRDERVLDHLAHNVDVMYDLVKSLSVPLDEPHQAGEWTVKDILVHVMDAERVFSYRALRIARGDTTPLPGYEQDDYAPHASANTRTLDDIFAEYRAIRQATLTLFNSFDDEALLRQGTGSGFPVSVRAAVHQIAGHELFHIQSIKENYGS